MGDTIVLDELSVRYGRDPVLEGFSLSVGQGVFGLLGPNGAGKTTLVRVLATALKPQSGTVRVLDRDLTNDSDLVELRRCLGYLPQSFGFYPGFTALEFVQYMGWLKEVDPSQLKSEAEKALNLVGLSDKAHVSMRRLSGGQIRRVGIAQALVNRPQVLLLDEPTAGLDPQQRVEFRQLLRELGTKAAVVVSTHLVEDVMAACTSVGIVSHGRLRFQGLPSELIALGEGHPNEGDTPLERGYIAAVERGPV